MPQCSLRGMDADRLSLGLVADEDEPKLPDHLASWWAKHGERFHVVGPCVDGDYYAWLRGEPFGARIFGEDMADLIANLRAAWLSRRLFGRRPGRVGLPWEYWA